jgi:hypothetical protein
MVSFTLDLTVPVLYLDLLAIGNLFPSSFLHLHTYILGDCRKGGPPAVTDANLLLGRLIPDYFPKIFGQSEKEPLDVDASRTAFEKLAKEINAGNDKELSLDEIVYGCISFFFF